MPKFLEQRLRGEYGNNPHAIYGTMNAIGAMHGNKKTAKGRQMEAKHEKDKHTMKTAAVEPMRHMRIEILRDKNRKPTGATVHHDMMPKPTSKSGAFMEHNDESHPFSAGEHEKMIAHISKHLKQQMAGGAAAAAEKPGDGAKEEHEDEAYDGE